MIKHSSGVTGLEIPEVVTVRVNRDSMYIEWTAVVEAVEYTLMVEEKNGQQPNQLIRVRATQGPFYNVTNLKPGTTYCVRLAAKYTVDQSSFSKLVCRTTSIS